MHREDGAAAMDDLVLLLVAVVAFSLFFASVAGAYVAREAESEGARLQEDVEAFLEAVLEHPSWTLGRGKFLADALGNATGEDLAPLAEGRPFLVVLWDVVSDARWTFGERGPGDRRTASTSASIIGEHTDAARVTATLWEGR